MIETIGTVALYVDNQEAAVEYWTKRLGFEVRTKRTLGAAGSWVEIAPPGADSCLVLYPKTLMPDWAARKPSVFDCDDVLASVARPAACGSHKSQRLCSGACSRPFSTAKIASMDCAVLRKLGFSVRSSQMTLMLRCAWASSRRLDRTRLR
jgi:lactoylglutathione lyase